MNDFLLRLKAGFDIGGITINAAFLTGGAFSYDGFHLTPIGYALLADDLTQFMNANFDAGLPRVNLTTYLFNGGTNGGLSGSSVLRAAERRGLRKGRPGDLHARVRPPARVDVLRCPKPAARAGARQRPRFSASSAIGRVEQP